MSVFIKLFVAFHVIAITSWSLPPPPEKESYKIEGDTALKRVQSVGRLVSDGTLYLNENYVKTSPVRPYLLFTGFWQYWDMFSPNPANTDFYGTATIVYKDGTVKPYQYPRMYTLGIGKKYVSERYRKFYERANPESGSWMWPVFAQRIALINDTDPNNPPTTVILTRHWQVVAEPGKLQRTDYHHYDYFTYSVNQLQLAKDKAGGFFG